MLELIKTQMKIPLNNKLSIGELTQVFNNTAASYKYYWFLSLLQLFIKNKENSEIEAVSVEIVEMEKKGDIEILVQEENQITQIAFRH